MNIDAMHNEEREIASLFAAEGMTEPVIRLFRDLVLARHRQVPRPMPWRETRDPYAILVSEIMLQQTRVERVLGKYGDFLDAFPDLESLAAAQPAEVLRVWHGLGYNRRGLALKRAAEQAVAEHGGELPEAAAELVKFPGIGPYTAGAVAAFAFGERCVFIETNIRSVFLHFFFSARDEVNDREILPLVSATLPEEVREWYYALMDYGAFLKKSLPNPSRRSRHHVKQSPFHGSDRQIRGLILKTLLTRESVGAEELARATGSDPLRVEENAGRLEAEGFLVREAGGRYRLR